MDELYQKANEYFDKFLDLIELIYINVYSEIPSSPFVDKEKVKVVKNTINLDKWYK